MRGSINLREGDVGKSSSIGEKSKKRPLTKAGETLTPCKNRNSTVSTETRLSLSRSSNNDGGSLMMVFGTRSSKKVREQVVTKRNIHSNAILHHRSSRSMEACDSLLCVGTPNNIDIMTKMKSPRSKPRRLISRVEKSMLTVNTDEFVDPLDQFDDLIFDSDPISDQRTTDEPAILSIDQCNQVGISERAVDCESVAIHKTELGSFSTLEKTANDEDDPKTNTLQQLRCTGKNSRRESVNFSSIENKSAHISQSVKTNNYPSAATAKNIHLVDDASINSNMWSMHASVSEEDQVSRNTATASATSAAVISIEIDDKALPLSFESKTASLHTKNPSQLSTDRFSKMDDFDIWVEQSLPQAQGSNLLRSSPLPDKDLLWEDFKRSYKVCEIPHDSELGKWLEEIVARLSSIASKDHIKCLIDAGIDWPFRPGSPISSRRIVAHDTAGVREGLLDITTGKQDSVTSSITTTTIEDERQQNTNRRNIDVRPVRKRISLIPRIHGRRENPVRNKGAKFIARRENSLRRSLGDVSQPDSDEDSYNSYCCPHELYVTKFGLKRKRLHSNPWSDLLSLGEHDGSRIRSMRTKRMKTSQVESDAHADVLQNLFGASTAAV